MPNKLLLAATVSFLLATAALAQTPAPDHSKHDAHMAHKAQGQQADHMHKRFENAEQWSKNFDDPARDAWQMPDKVIALLGLKAGQKVADIGAGTGYFTSRLAKAAKVDVYPADIEPDMVRFLTERAHKEHLPNVHPVLAAADSANLPVPMDLILIVDTIHHIGNREAYYKKLAGSLKPGGKLAIIDWRPGGPMGPPEQFRLSEAKIAAELATAGFKQTAKHDFLPNQHFLLFQR